MVVSSGPPVCQQGADWGKTSGSSSVLPTFVPTGKAAIDLPLLGIDLGLFMLNEGFKDAANAEQRRRARREAEEYARQIEAERHAAAEAARREESYRTIAGQLKGVGSGGRLGLKRQSADELKFKVGDASRPRSAFDQYLARETERREKLERSEDARCQLKPALYPQRPLRPIPEAQYEKLLAYYQASKASWDQRCAAAVPPAPLPDPLPAALPTAPESPAASPAPTRPATRDPLIPLPIACDDCWSNYERESRACLSHDTSVERLVCLNGVRDAWVFCVAGCRAEPTTPVKFRR